VAELASPGEGVVAVVGLVDDEVARCERTQRRLPRQAARQGLLDIEQLRRNRGQLLVALESGDQAIERRTFGILLVGIERDDVVVGKGRKLSSDTDQAARVGVWIAGQLEL